MQTAQNFLNIQNELGEGSFWNAADQQLYWLDILRKRFYRMRIETKEYEYFNVGVKIGVMTPRQKGGLVMATDQGFAFWHPDNTLEFIVNPIASQAERRFNDGNIDAKGRFWAGTMCDPPASCPTPQAALYRLDLDGSLHQMDSGLGLPNGLVWSPDNKIMYLTDSSAHTIYMYDFNLESGSISNRRPFIRSENEPGVPDGLTIDSAGFLWSMRYNGWKITRYDPDGKVEREIHIPVPRPTSCTFAGPQLTDLYITTAWENMDEKQREQSPQSGDLFHLQTDITGPVRRSFAG